MKKISLDSHAKVNLYLKVLNKRKDNYHNIDTVFERICLCDKIILSSRRDSKINIICNNTQVPRGSANLCYSAASLMRERFNIKGGVDIKIIKRIPLASGLAGGSSNAASVLLGLNKLWGLKLSLKTLAGLAGKIGSDVPFFIYNTPFALGRGRGEKIRPLKALKNVRLWHILVVPKIRILTPEIYQKWDAFCRLTSGGLNVKLLISGLRKGDFLSISRSLFNSLEQVTERAYPEVARVKNRLSRLGLKSILMSGSGPAVYALVPSRKEAVTLKRKLELKIRSCRCFVTRTV